MPDEHTPVTRAELQHFVSRVSELIAIQENQISELTLAVQGLQSQIKGMTRLHEYHAEEISRLQKYADSILLNQTTKH